MARILALGGDGIGPEILDQGLRVAAFLNNAAGLDLEVLSPRHCPRLNAIGTFLHPRAW